MSFVIDSNAPYFTEFPLNSTGNAVYMTAEDSVLGSVFAIVYRAHRGNPKLSVILIGAHGTSGYVDMTLDRTSRFFGACRGLAPSHYHSPVRRALAIATLRTYATVDKPLKQRLRGMCDESAAGSLGSRFRLVYGKFPGVIGGRVIEAGFISPKKVDTAIVDIIYEDSDLTIDRNNELVHLLGEQLEQLFDPLSEYSPEPTERLYTAPVDQGDKSGPANNRNSTLDQDPKEIQDLCEELYLLQAHARGDILDLLQTTLIPLRIEVLKGNFPNISIARLNSVFPPTIDELFRVNNIFYEALRSALPFGAFEVMKACGATIPYFFRACMRHEAATQNFRMLLTELLADAPEVLQFVPAEKHKDIETLIGSPSHLMNIKALLDPLAVSLRADPRFNEKQIQQIDEFYSVASGTVDAFTDSHKDTSRSAGGLEKSREYENRKLGSAGKVLGEIAQGWPVELEYGWLNRRVVAIFDAVDVLEPSESLRQLHVVFIVFTDYVVVCRPSEPIPVSSLSGLHIPSVGDMLMHAMLNDAAVDRNLPPLKVISWAPILEVHFASYAKQYLYVFSPGIIGSYRLLQPDSDSNNLVTLLAKAKITTKTQPFHLFKIEGPQFTVYSTVQELEGYQEEMNRTGVALVLSREISVRTLRKYDLNAAISLQICEDNEDLVSVCILSRMRYHANFTIPKTEVRELVINELAYLMTLSLSSQNMAMLDVIITSNKLASNRLIKWAAEPGNKPSHGHRKANNRPTHSAGTNVGGANAAERGIRSANNKSSIDSMNDAPAISQLSSDDVTVNHILRKIPGKVPGKARDEEQPIFTEDGKDAQDGGVEASKLDGDISYSSYSSITSRATYETNDGDSQSGWASSEEAEQRDVDNWYHQLNNGYADDESLNSDLSDTDLNYSVTSRRSIANSASIQIGAFLDRSASNLYNQNAGRAFPRIVSNHVNESLVHRRQETESSFETVASLQDSFETSEASFVSGNTTVANDNDVEDFSYLASLVDVTSFNSKLSELEKNGVYPDLRDTSLVRLGSYVVRHDQGRSRSSTKTHTDSQRGMSNSRNSDLSGIGQLAEEDTPTLKSENFSAPPPQLAETEDWILLDRGLSEREKVESKSAKSSPQKKTNFQPFADIESVKWQPLAVRSGSNKTLGGHMYFPELGDIHENSFEDDDGLELAQDWLRWSKMTRPISTISVKTITNVDTPASSVIDSSPSKSGKAHSSPSTTSFRRMVMSSSLHTLQLASFTVQIEQKQTSSPPGLKADLEHLKEYVTNIYKMRTVTPESERTIRTNLTTFFELLIKQECDQLAFGLLEIEWVRRSRIIELDYTQASRLWKFD